MIVGQNTESLESRTTRLMSPRGAAWLLVLTVVPRLVILNSFLHSGTIWNGVVEDFYLWPRLKN